MAQLTTEELNALPDDAFALVEDGGTKDSSGKTVPRSLRHFAIHDAAHVRDALSRAPQSPFGEKAMPKILGAAAKFGVKTAGQSAIPEYMIPERRFTPGVVVMRDAGDKGKRIVGYGSVFNKLSRNLGGFVENVRSTAFNQSMADGWPGAVCRYNHDPNMLLGTIGGGTVSLRTDNLGLQYDVLPPQSRADILELVDRGDIRHSSFAFRVPAGGDEWGITDQQYPLRSLLTVELVDVAPVVDPAYPDATAGLRSLAAHMEAPYEDVADLAQKDELRKFFIRTDKTAGAPAGKPRPPKVRLYGPAAAMALLERRRDPLDTES